MKNQNVTVGVDVKFNTEIGNIKTAAENIRKILSGVKIPEANAKRAQEDFANLEAAIRDYQSIANKPVKTNQEMRQVSSAAKEVITSYDRLEKEMKDIKGLDLNTFIPKDAKKRIDALRKEISGFNEKNQPKQQKVKDAQGLVTRQQKKVNQKEIKKDAETQKLQEAIRLQEQLNALKQEATTKGHINKDGESLNKATTEGKKYYQVQQQLHAILGNTDGGMTALKASVEKATGAWNDAKHQLKGYETQLESAEQAMKDLGKEAVPDDVINRLKQLGIDTTTIKSFEDLEQAVGTELANGLTLASQKVEALGANMKNGGAAAEQFEGKIEDASQSVKELTETQKQMEQLRHRMLEFFSIGNAVQLFKQAVRSAFETVKELDAAMTEIAVVSDFTVGDMWDRLPEFTEQANELGVAVKDTYNAVGLFVQQGLDLNASMELSTETLKMARIAGLDAAEATDSMTAALRGFNMTLDETSGKRVNDVYSELAAITASDVGEISTAMSKVASIANSANMEFENTAAFLSQIIETTR